MSVVAKFHRQPFCRFNTNVFAAVDAGRDENFRSRCGTLNGADLQDLTVAGVCFVKCHIVCGLKVDAGVGMFHIACIRDRFHITFGRFKLGQ